MNEIKKISLSHHFKEILDIYSIDEYGNIYKAEKKLKTQRDYKLKTKEGKWISRSIRTLYRAVFGIEYCIDTVLDLPEEEWKVCIYDSRYKISNKGRIKSFCGFDARILNATDNGAGYLRVSIGEKDFLLHRLVAIHFVENPDGVDTVDHKDTNTHNNNEANLQWLTRSENSRLAHERRRKKQEAEQREK